MNKLFKIFISGLLTLVVSFNLTNAETMLVTINFSKLPGPDGILGTADDISPTSAEEIKEGYASLGAHFSGPFWLDYCCGLDDTLGVLAISGPFSIVFDNLQTSISFDIVGAVRYIGRSLPVSLYDASGAFIETQVLSQGGGMLFGRFTVSSPSPFSKAYFGVTGPSGGGFFFDNLEFEGNIPPPPSLIDAVIDIKPHSPNNNISSESNGYVSVALLGSEKINVSDIAIETVVFGPLEAKNQENKIEDINKDGFEDIILKFRVSDIGITCEDTSAKLSGQTNSLQTFSGSDKVSISGCGQS